MNTFSVKSLICRTLRVAKENAFFVLFFVYRVLAIVFPGNPVPVASCPVLFLAVLLCFHKNHLKIIRTEALCILLSLLNTVPLALAGLADSGVYTERSVIRSGLGTGHPNWLSADLFYLLVLLYIGHIVRERKWQLVLTACVYAVCEYVTRTRTVSYLCLLFVAVLFMEWLRKQKRASEGALSLVLRVTDYLAVFAFPVVCAVSLVLVYCYQKGYGFANKINMLLANRVYLACDRILVYGITPFGSLFQEVKAGGTEMEYVTILVRMGVAGLTVFGVLWVLLSLRCLRNGKRRLLYALALYAVNGITEQSMLSDTGIVFFFLVLADLTNAVPEEPVLSDPNTQIVRAASVVAPAAGAVCLMPYLFERMRTVVQLVPGSHRGAVLHIRVWVAFFLLLVLAGSIVLLIRSALLKKTPVRNAVYAAAGCLVILLIHFIYGGSVLRKGAAGVQELLDADAKAIEVILSSKTGVFYADPYPVLYRQRFPGISRSVLSGKDLARTKNATVLTDIGLDGDNTFQTQGFLYIPVSDAHAVYSNDEPVIAALQEAGFPVSPFFNRRIHVDLEQCAKDSYLVYEASFPGIVIDQASEVEEQRAQNIWSDFNKLYCGYYEVTFTCRLLWPEENAPDEYCILGVNYSLADEIAQDILTVEEAGENNYVIKTVPFYVPYSLHGYNVSFSVYGGNIRRLVVEDISFVRVG